MMEGLVTIASYSTDWSKFLSEEVREASRTGQHLTFEPLLAELLVRLDRLTGVLIENNLRLEKQEAKE